MKSVSQLVSLTPCIYCFFFELGGCGALKLGAFSDVETGRVQVK